MRGTVRFIRLEGAKIKRKEDFQKGQKPRESGREVRRKRGREGRKVSGVMYDNSVSKNQRKGVEFLRSGGTGAGGGARGSRD